MMQDIVYENKGNSYTATYLLMKHKTCPFSNYYSTIKQYGEVRHAQRKRQHVC